MVPAQVEALTQRIGREIFDRLHASRPGPWNALWWEERLMGVMTADEVLKVQAFRFIDALPTLRDPADVARHLREYFGEGLRPASPNGENGKLSRRQTQRAALAELDATPPGGLARFVSGLMRFRRDDSFQARLIGWAARQTAEKMAFRFIAGSTLREAERAIVRMRAAKLGFTLDVLGEAALSQSESDYYQQIYVDLLTELPRRAAEWPVVPLIDRAGDRVIPTVNVSVKLSALFPGFDAIDPAGTAAVVKDRLRPLLRLAMAGGAHLHIDMEHYFFKDLTLEIVQQVFAEKEFRDYPHFGVVLQAYLKDGERDAAAMIDFAERRGTPIWIRLVKGAYWDTETVLHDQFGWPWPVWEQKWQSDACYERMTRMLLSRHNCIFTAFGSHNIRSIAYALALKHELGVPPHAFEIQMLYGMGDPIKRAIAERGERCRVYTPYGEMMPGMAYLIRRLLENTANESFLRHSVDASTPVDALLRDPERIGAETPPPRRPVNLKYEFGELIMDPFENIPNTDFTRETARQEMTAALERVRAQLGKQIPLVIGGERVTSAQQRDSVNPANPSEIIGRVSQADEAATQRAVESARTAFARWRKAPVAQRTDVLREAARIMQQERFDLAALICLECGKPWREADADVSEAIDFCNYYAHEMTRLAENPRRRDIPGESNEYFYAPRGVVAVISPWNFPLAILTGMATAALVTGNTTILKPAAPATVIAYRLVEILERAGAPAGTVNYLPGSGAVVGETLVKHPHVAMIAFTGSREVGVRINQLAAAHPTAQPALKKVVAEMGGKNAVIIDTDADPDEAVRGVLASAFGYAGQKCSAASRCIVLDGVYDRFVPRLVEAARALSVGPAEDPGAAVPPVIDQSAAESIRRYIEAGKNEARCALEIDVSDLRQRTGGYFVGPTIFVDVSPSARINREEIFGPVLAVLRARDMDHAIELFNDSDFALTGGIFSRSPANIEKARAECECGNFYINRKISGALVDIQPFGGFKMSGIGSKAGGPDYLVQFCEPRCVTENTLRRGFAPSEDVATALS